MKHSVQSSIGISPLLLKLAVHREAKVKGNKRCSPRTTFLRSERDHQADIHNMLEPGQVLIPYYRVSLFDERSKVYN